MNGKIIHISELDAKISVLRIDIAAIFLFTIGISLMLYVNGTVGIYIRPYNSIINVLSFILILIVIMILLISLICGKNYLKFLDIVYWPAKHILKEK